MANKWVGSLHTHAAWGVCSSCERRTKREVARKCATERHNPCCVGGPQRFKGDAKITSGREFGRVAT